MSIMISPTSLSEKVIEAICEVVGDESAVLHEPIFIGNEWLYLKECPLKSINYGRREEKN